MSYITVELSGTKVDVSFIASFRDEIDGQYYDIEIDTVEIGGVDCAELLEPRFDEIEEKIQEYLYEEL